MHVHKSPWLKRVLIPFWIIQLLILAAEIAVQSFQVNYITDFNIRLSTGYLALVGVILGLTCLFAVFKILEIVLFANHALSPPTFLILQVLPTTAFTALLITQIVLAAVSYDSGYRPSGAVVVGVAVDAIIWAMFLATLIYGAVIYHRYRKAKRVERERDPNMYHHGYLALGSNVNTVYGGARGDEEIANQVGLQLYN